ncbi:hypothetical protein D3C80_1692900 [compost metagenome]
MQAGLAIVADHRTEVFRLHDPVDGDNWNAFGLQQAIAVVPRWQATGDDQGITTTGAEQLKQLPFTVRCIV